MAFAAGTIWQNWSTGAVGNGGAFDPTNANFATDLAVDTNTGNTASPIVSSASYNFAAGDVGAWVFVQSGTGWTPGWYKIASVAANKATLTGTIGTAVLYSTVITSMNYHRPNGLNTVAGCCGASSTGGVWSIDYSQQTAALYTYTDLIIGADTTTFTSVGHPVGPNIVGNTINITSGTGFTVQRVQVISFTLSGLVGTADKSLGTTASTSGNGALGGAIGSSSTLTALTQALVAGNKVYIKATGTYTLTVTTTVTATVKGDTTSGRISVEGFTTYPGQLDGRPVITSATNSVALLTINDNDFWEFVHLKLTHTAATRGGAFTTTAAVSSPLWIKDCIIDGCLNLFASSTNMSVMYVEGCEIMNTTSATAAFSASSNGTYMFFGCDIHDNAGDGVRTTGNTTVALRGCIFDTNVVGYNCNSTSNAATVTITSCTFVDNTSDGIKIASNTGINTLELENNIIGNNGGWGINNLDTQAETDPNVRINRNNAFGWPNTSGAYTGLAGGRGEITLTADPFTNRAGRDFSLNNTAGGGALVRATAFPTTFPAGTTLSYRDIGAAQHQDSGGTTTYVVAQHITQHTEEINYY